MKVSAPKTEHEIGSGSVWIGVPVHMVIEASVG